MLVVSVILFLIVQILPGDPAQMILGQEATPEALQRLREQMGLNDPLIVQYTRWIGRVLRGDLGVSVHTGQPVAELIGERLTATLMLAAGGLVVSVGVGLPAGILAAVLRGRYVERFMAFITFLGVSTPQFWLGILLILLFSLRLRWLPPGGFTDPGADLAGSLSRLVMPALTLGLTLSALIMRMTRTSMLEVMRADFVRTARAKGLAEGRVVLRHVLRNALIPTVTVIGLQLGYLFGSAIVVEEVFFWPGLGRLVLSAVNYRDLPLLQGVVLMITAAYVVVNLLIDISYAYLNPRIRYP